MRLGRSACGRFLDYVGIRRASITVAFYSVAAMLTSFATGLGVCARFDFFWERENRRTGRAPRKPSPNGFRVRRAAGRSLCSIADRQSAERSRRSLFIRSTDIGRLAAGFLVTGLLGLLWIPLFRWLYRQTGGTSALYRRNENTF